MTKYVGLSLSFYIKDICEGRVPLEDVEKIIAGTCAMSEHEWELLLNQYSEVYWRECKECALPCSTMECYKERWYRSNDYSQ